MKLNELEIQNQIKDKKKSPLNKRKIISLKTVIKIKFRTENKPHLKQEDKIQLKKKQKIYSEMEDKSNMKKEENSNSKIEEKIRMKNETNNKTEEKKEYKTEYKENCKIKEKNQLKKEEITFFELEKVSFIKMEEKEKSVLQIEEKFLLKNRNNSIISKKENHIINRKSSLINLFIKNRNFIKNMNILGIKEVLPFFFFSLYSFFIILYSSFDGKENNKKIEGIKIKKSHQVKMTENKSAPSKYKKNLRKNIYYKEDVENRIINYSNKVRNIISFNNSDNIIIYLIMFILFIQILPPNCNCVESIFSKITLKINATGIKNVFTDFFYFKSIYYPNIIYTNGERQSTINYNYYFNQTDNFVDLIWNNSINDSKYMFYLCSDIDEIDLSHFDTSIITDMNNMFNRCSGLVSLDLSNFNTSRVTDMSYMFTSCSKLTSLNLFNFNTSLVTAMDCMFCHCSGLSSLDLSNFNTSIVTNMGAMFNGCSGLISLDLSNFNTSKVSYMYTMFSGCSELSSLDLSNFNTSAVTSMNYMFSGSSRLSYINLKNFVENSSLTISNIFSGIPENVVICLNNNNNKLLSEIIKINCYTIDCSDNWGKNRKNIVNKRNLCFDDFNNDILYKYEYNNKYYDTCLNGVLSNNYTIKNCTCDNEKCLSCPNEPLKEDLCIRCNNNYYEIKNDNYSYIEGYVKCYKNPKGYYLDKNESIFKKCYYTCKECENIGDNRVHNCIKCKDNYPLEIKTNNYSNCYKSCNYYYYFDIDNNFHCTTNKSCPDRYHKLSSDKKECFKNIKLKYLIEEIINNKEIIEKKTEKEIEYYDTIIKNIEIVFTSDYCDISDLDNGKDEIIETEKIKITFTTIKNQKNFNNDNMTNIDLRECEMLLRKYYNLINNETLYIKQLDIKQKGMKISKIEFDVYSKLYGLNLTKLNLSICQNYSIFLFIPMKIEDNLDKLNSSSRYYNDICYITTSESGTDISLKDRKKEYVNKAICQEDCNFFDYNYNILKAICSCKLKESFSSLANMTINKEKLLANFKNVKNIANLNILKCVYILLSKEGIIKNIGFYILLIIIIFFITSFFLFYIKQYVLLKKKIEEIAYSLNYYNLLKRENTKDKGNEFKLDNINNINIEDNKMNNNKISLKKQEKKCKNKIELETNIHITNNDNIKNNIINGKILNNKKKGKRKKKIKRINNIINFESVIKNIIDKNYNNDFNNNISIENSKSKDEIDKIQKLMDYNDDEINDFPFDLALKYDKRTYCQYYISLIKTKHKLIFSFIYNKDYNSSIIKIDLFFICLAINYTINALFYNDNTMHNIYVNNGSFKLDYQLPKIVYSSIISSILDSLMKILALSNDDVIKFKNNKEKENINERKENLNK